MANEELEYINEDNDFVIEEEKKEPEKTKKISYILINPPHVATKTTSEGVERIDMENFLIKRVNFNELKKGQWFFFVDPTSNNGSLIDVYQDPIDRSFLFNCESNPQNGEEIEVRLLAEFSDEDKIATIDRIKRLLKEYKD